MTHDFQTIEAIASRLCHDAGGDWEKRRAYWTRKAVARVELDERTQKMKSEYLWTWTNSSKPSDTKWWMFS